MSDNAITDIISPGQLSGAGEKLLITRVITNGTFALDGGEWDVENNIWVIGDDKECYIIDAAHELDPIQEAVDGREVKAILCTHAHNDHITVAPELSQIFGAGIYVHPADRVLWDQSYPDLEPKELADGDVFEVGGVELKTMNTPGHSPGCCVFYVPAADVLFSGDTLFNGGPGATGRSFSDFDTIIESIKTKLLTLPAETKVLTGHGDSTTIGDEAPHLEEWIKRGY